MAKRERDRGQTSGEMAERVHRGAVRRKGERRTAPYVLARDLSAGPRAAAGPSHTLIHTRVYIYITIIRVTSVMIINSVNNGSRSGGVRGVAAVRLTVCAGGGRRHAASVRSSRAAASWPASPSTITVRRGSA